MAELDQELERLYGLRPEAFTEARNELAKRLQQDGEKDAAREVKALRKPTIPAWILNQLARHEPELLQRLFESGDDLRRAQTQALAGGGADELRTATSAERETVRELMQRARELAKTEGRAPPPAVLERVRTSLSAAAVDEALRPELERGTVPREFEQVGFAQVTPQTGSRPAAKTAKPAPPPKRPVRDELAERRKQRDEHRQRVQSLRAEVRERKREADDAHRRAERAARQAERAREAADEAERAREAAEREDAELATEVDRLTTELAEAELRLRARSSR
jgi:uncharacterized coiled-coil DUF342 family protein